MRNTTDNSKGGVYGLAAAFAVILAIVLGLAISNWSSTPPNPPGGLATRTVGIGARPTATPTRIALNRPSPTPTRHVILSTPPPPPVPSAVPSAVKTGVPNPVPSAVPSSVRTVVPPIPTVPIPVPSAVGTRGSK